MEESWEDSMAQKSDLRRLNARLGILLIRLIMVVGFVMPASAQEFSSGSNQTDGALDLTSKAPGTIVNFVPSNYLGNQHALNIFNFTDITIPARVTVKLSGNTINGP